MAQNGIITHTRNHRRHQLVDKFTGGGEAIHVDAAFPPPPPPPHTPRPPPHPPPHPPATLPAQPPPHTNHPT
ncbi:hypothetical protein PV939_10390, partial [Ligilactobacillus salivarius]|nr:hypothetical protein [Ligilactobacillus salivarius]